jgi:hypothetical protein
LTTRWSEAIGADCWDCRARSGGSWHPMISERLMPARAWAVPAAAQGGTTPGQSRAGLGVGRSQAPRSTRRWRPTGSRIFREIDAEIVDIGRSSQKDVRSRRVASLATLDPHHETTPSASAPLLQRASAPIVVSSWAQSLIGVISSESSGRRPTCVLIAAAADGTFAEALDNSGPPPRESPEGPVEAMLYGSGRPRCSASAHCVVRSGEAVVCGSDGFVIVDALHRHGSVSKAMRFPASSSR